MSGHGGSACRLAATGASSTEPSSLAQHGRAPRRNGVFAARVMWGSMPPLVEGLDPARLFHRDLEPRRCVRTAVLVRLQREDVVAQAVSWARAEQTGYWQQGDSPSVEPHFDLDDVEALVRTVQRHNAEWSTWFSEQGAQPYAVTYEDVVADPRSAVHGILDRLGVEPPSGWRPDSPHDKQADEVNAEWIRRYRIAQG